MNLDAGTAYTGGMDEKQKRRCRWFQFSLRTLLILVTGLRLWIGWQLKWIRDRHVAIEWVERQAA